MSVTPAEDLTAAAADPVGEFRVALAVGCLIDAEQSVAELKSRTQHFFAPLATQNIHSCQGLLDWFVSQGFGGGATGAVDENHSNVARVIESREGIPISLAMLLVEAARQVGLESHGINFPGHFLVAVDGVLVDPLAMRIVPEKDLDPAAGPLEVASPRDIALRMLNNIKALRFAGQTWAQALDIIELQMALARGDAALEAALHYERGELWANLGAYRTAVDEFRRCAEIAPSVELAEQARQGVERLKAQADNEIHH